MGDVFLKDTGNSLIRAESRLVVALGLDNLMVVETPDAVMIAPTPQAQNIKSLVSDLKNRTDRGLDTPESFSSLGLL